MVDQGSARFSLLEELPGETKTHLNPEKEEDMSYERKLHMDFPSQKKKNKNFIKHYVLVIIITPRAHWQK